MTYNKRLTVSLQDSVLSTTAAIEESYNKTGKVPVELTTKRDDLRRSLRIAKAK